MSATPTEAHLKLVLEIMGEDQANEKSPAYAMSFAQLLADSEARAVEALSAEKCDLQNKVDNFDANWEQQQIIVRRLRERVRVLEEALAQIEAYGNGRGDGCCPYGCDTPTIARAALAPPERKEGSG